MRNSTEITPYLQEERLLIIQQSYGQGTHGKGSGFPTYEELAKRCKCSISTIYLDMKVWKEQGGLDIFILQEFNDLYPMLKEEEPMEVFKIISRFLQKGMTQKVAIDQRIQIGTNYSDALKRIFVEVEAKVIDKGTEQHEEPAKVSA